jgi:prepilin-type processing-associated H-X9-DG protein
VVFLFPFIEQAARWDAINGDGNWPRGGTRHDRDMLNYPGDTANEPAPEAAQRALSARLTIAQCPSDGAGATTPHTMPGGVNFSPINLRFSVGDGAWHNNRPDFAEGDARARCSNRGMFSPYHRRNLSYASDGLSNTLFASESCIPENGSDRDIRRGVARVGEMHSGVSLPSRCASLAPSTDNPRLLDADRSNNRTRRGWALGDGRAPVAAFTTILPPNSVSCIFADANWQGWGVWSPTSYHSGGVQCLFGDGSVRFVSDSVNANAPAADSDYTGQSRYGVWGALGTPRGGESASL